MANRIIISRVTDPFFNASLGSYLTVHNPFKTLFLSSSQRVVMIGRNQNNHSETHRQNMEIDQIPLLRRDTGGGACYIDLGNRLFSIIQPITNSNQFQQNYIMLMNAFKIMKFDPKLGRNDLTINGHKVSGSAMTIQNEMSKHHGTILLNVDKDRLTRYLNPHKLKLQSHGIASVKSRVINLCELRPELTQLEVDKALIQSFRQQNGWSDIQYIDNNHHIHNDPKFIAILNHYRSHDYIYNQNPSFTHKLEHKFSFGLTELFLTCDKNVVIECHMFSDCLDMLFMTELKTLLTASQWNYQPESIRTFQSQFKQQFQNHELYNSYIDEFCDWLCINL